MLRTEYREVLSALKGSRERYKNRTSVNGSSRTGIHQLTIALCICLTSGCGALLYVPDAHIVPLSGETRQIQLAANVGSSLDYGGEIVSTPIPHLVVFVRGSRLNSDSYRKKFLESGLGVSYQIRRNMTADVLIGLGSGPISGSGNRTEISLNGISRQAFSFSTLQNGVIYN